MTFTILRMEAESRGTQLEAHQSAVSKEKLHFPRWQGSDSQERQGPPALISS